jgi:hypothetical protein
MYERFFSSFIFLLLIIHTRCEFLCVSRCDKCSGGLTHDVDEPTTNDNFVETPEYIMPYQPKKPRL